MHTHSYIYMHTYMHAYMHACMHACIHTYRYLLCTCVRTNVGTYMLTYVHIHTNSWLQIFLLLTLLFCCRPRGTLFVAVLAGGGGRGRCCCCFRRTACCCCCRAGARVHSLTGFLGPPQRRQKHKHKATTANIKYGQKMHACMYPHVYIHLFKV